MLPDASSLYSTQALAACIYCIQQTEKQHRHRSTRVESRVLPVMVMADETGALHVLVCAWQGRSKPLWPTVQRA